jgi:hypothetical protein
MQANQFSLHAREGCMLKKTNALAYTGTELFEDCNYVFNVGSLFSIHKRSTCAD